MPTHNTHRNAKVSQEILKQAAIFLRNEANRTSMITVTRVDLSPEMKNCTVFFTVFPDAQEEPVLSFVRRNAGDFRTYIAKETKISILPTFTFEIDYGDKNRRDVTDALNRKP
jgi:ribosome-binding factor A